LRRWLTVLLLLVLGGAAFWVTWSVLNGPHYALYQIGKGIHEREPRRVLAYVDVERIARGQKDELIAEFMAEKSQDERNQVSQIVGALMGALAPMVKDRVAQVVADPNRDNIPSSFTLVAAADVTTNGDYAMVVLSEPEGGQGRRLRMGMQRHQELGHWQVVEINPQDLRRLISEYMEKRRK